MLSAPLRLLLVEDAPLVRRSLARALRSVGFEVVDVATVEQALEALERERWDVVVTDEELGGPQLGSSILARVRERSPTTRRVLLSGSAPHGVEAHMDAGDIEIFHEKPIGLDEIRALHAWATSVRTVGR